MTVSLADVPFPVSKELAVRWDFYSFGRGVTATCGACGFTYAWGANGIKRLPRATTPPELAAHVCAEPRS